MYLRYICTKEIMIHTMLLTDSSVFVLFGLFMMMSLLYPKMLNL